MALPPRPRGRSQVASGAAYTKALNDMWEADLQLQIERERGEREVQTPRKQKSQREREREIIRPSDDRADAADRL